MIMKSRRLSHFLRAVRGISHILYIAVGIFLALFVVFHIGNSFYIAWTIESQQTLVRHGLEESRANLQRDVLAIAEEPRLNSALKEKNRSEVLGLIQEEARRRNLSGLTIADDNGVAIGRTINQGRYGDNIFLTSSIGRAVSEGGTIQSIEQNTAGTRLYLIGGQPIVSDNLQIGGLFASVFLNDAFAAQFKERYLPIDAEIIFYTKGGGVFGNSFTNTEIRTDLNSYFNSGSDWIKNSETNKTVTLQDGRSFSVVNEVFKGIEQESGGALLFIPRHDVSMMANIIATIIAVLVFIALALRRHLRHPEERGFWYTVTLIVAALLASGIAFLLMHLQTAGRTPLTHVPYPLYNSTMRLEPESGIFDTVSEQSVAVIVDTGDESINTVQVRLTFDPSALTVISLEPSAENCPLVVEKTIDQVGGAVTISCVLPGRQGGAQRSLAVADLRFIPVQSGTFAISFDQNQTRVLANDGLATDVLRASQDGSYRFYEFDPSLVDDAAPADGRQFIVYSPSHPNESRWYNLTKARFVWRGAPGAVYRYAFDSSPDTTPTDGQPVQGTKVELPIPGNGIYYFHLQLAAGGPVAHYRIRSDITPPTITSMDVSQANITQGDVVRFSFDASDAASGIQKNYYVDLGNRLFLPIGNTLFVPFLVEGDQDITLRVYDSAGNYSERTETIRVKAKK